MARVAFVARRLGDAGGAALPQDDKDVRVPLSRDFSQDELYQGVVRPFVERCVLTGSSASILTYGGWGSGKSYTLGSLEPQQLTQPPNAENASAGVLLRCLQQLYEQLGPGAAVEITCVEVQGEDVLDLLDPKAGPAMGRVPGTPGAAAGQVTSPGATRSPIAVAATKRKPVALTVARSLAEALSTCRRAVAYRQAFVTSTRHSSSRTHLVVQLRWRNTDDGPSGASTGQNAGPGMLTAAGCMTRRPYSAPPRATPGLPTIGSGVVSLSGVGEGAGPVCTLTLVDTCSSCPLLPAKEASAVKKSLLALGRVLGAMQRREALMLRESKLTRLLEGSLDQALLLACLNGSPDDAGTLQLLKLLQQGASRDGASRRMRRVSSSDSARMSAAWDPAGTPSSVSLRSSMNGGPPTHAPWVTGIPSSHSKPAVARASTMQTYRQSPAKGDPAMRSMNTRISASAAASGTPPAVSASRIGLGGGLMAAVGTSGVTGASGRIRARPMPLEVLGGMEVEQTGGGEEDDVFPVPPSGVPEVGGGLSSAEACASPGGGSMGSPGPVLGSPSLSPGSVLPTTPPAASAMATSPGSVSTPACGRSRSISNSGIPAGSASAPNTYRLRGSVSMVYRGSMAASLAAESSGSAGAGAGDRAPVGMVTSVCGTRQRLASVTARAAPPDVRRSKGFSVLAGKWAPPPSPPSSASKQEPGFPVVPMVVGASNVSLGSVAPAARTPGYTRSPSGIPSAHRATTAVPLPRKAAAAAVEDAKSPAASPASAVPATPPSPGELPAMATAARLTPAAGDTGAATGVTFIAAHPGPRAAETAPAAEVAGPLGLGDAQHLDSSDEELVAHALAAAEAVASPSASPSATNMAAAPPAHLPASSPGVPFNADATTAAQQATAAVITPTKSLVTAAAAADASDAAAGQSCQAAGAMTAALPGPSPGATRSLQAQQPASAEATPVRATPTATAAAAVTPAMSPAHSTPERPTLSPTGGGLSAKAALAVVMQSRGTPGAKRRSGIPTPPGMASQPRTSPTAASTTTIATAASPAATQTPPNSARGAPTGATAATVMTPGSSGSAGGSVSRRRLISPSIPGAPAVPGPSTALASSTPRLISAGSGAGTARRGRVSIAVVGQPTVRASMRYGSSAQCDFGGSEGGAAVGGEAGLLSTPAGADYGAEAGTAYGHQASSLSPVNTSLLGEALTSRGGASRSSNGLRSPSPMLRERRALWLAATRRSRSALPRPIAELQSMEGLDDDAGRIEGANGVRAGAASVRARGRSGAGGHGGVTLSTQYRSLMSDFKHFQAAAANRTPRGQTSGNGRNPDLADMAAGRAAEAEPEAMPELEGAARFKRRFGSAKQLAPDESLMVVSEALKSAGYAVEGTAATGPRSPIVTGLSARTVALARNDSLTAATVAGRGILDISPSPSLQSGTPVLSPCRPPRYPGATPSPSAAPAAAAGVTAAAAVRTSTLGSGASSSSPSGSRPRLVLVPPDSPVLTDLNLLATAACVPSPSPRSITPSNRRISVGAMASATAAAVGGAFSVGANAAGSASAAPSDLRSIPSPAASPYLGAVHAQTPKRPSLLGIPAGALNVRPRSAKLEGATSGMHGAEVAAAADDAGSGRPPATAMALQTGKDAPASNGTANAVQMDNLGDDSGDDMFGPQLTPGGRARSILGPGSLADLNAMLRSSRAQTTPGSTPGGGQLRAASSTVMPGSVAAQPAADNPPRCLGSDGSGVGAPGARRAPTTSTSSPGAGAAGLPSPSAGAVAPAADVMPAPPAFRRALSRAGAEADSLVHTGAAERAASSAGAPAVRRAVESRASVCTSASTVLDEEELVADSFFILPQLQRPERTASGPSADAGKKRGSDAAAGQAPAVAAVAVAAPNVTQGSTSAVTDSGSFASAPGIAAATAAIAAAPGSVRGGGGVVDGSSLVLSLTGSSAATHGTQDIVAVGSPVLLSSPPTLAPPLDSDGSTALGASQRPDPPASAAARRGGIMEAASSVDFHPQLAGQTGSHSSTGGLGAESVHAAEASAGAGLPSLGLPPESLLVVSGAHELSAGETVLCGSCNLTPGDLAAVISHASAARVDAALASPAHAAAAERNAASSTAQASPGAGGARTADALPAGPSVGTVLAHYAHVPPNHSELDEHSNVLVLESDSEAEADELAVRPGLSPAHIKIAAAAARAGAVSAPASDVGQGGFMPPSRSTELDTPGRSLQGTPQKAQLQQPQQGTPSSGVAEAGTPLAAAQQVPQPAGLQQLLVPAAPVPPRQLSAGGAASWGSGRGSSTPDSPMGSVHPQSTGGASGMAELAARPSLGHPNPAPVRTAAAAPSSSAGTARAAANGESLGGVGSPLKSPKDGGASPMLNRRGRSPRSGSADGNVDEAEILPPPAYPPGFVHWATRLFSGGGAPEDQGRPVGN
ncbi:hypothetical protein HYH02_013586 [Chlamydomonas schloesseri]|uniref:Kinesin motor domain-containing protein n=1 Tax=Chlamydomonas schloesseri TaxID=2026947 RepID=A0A835SP51_9CHLO|nr:hypothetical protein HYH02_013586 [Chlamydomonas schloesseri]|eukprot:KAG2430747.1 hypothetical protein HYH02_013586 [Chlamydomonas schloesseri]